MTEKEGKMSSCLRKAPQWSVLKLFREIPSMGERSSVTVSPTVQVEESLSIKWRII